MLILQQPWTEQPQEAVWAASDLAGLQSLILPSQGFRDVLKPGSVFTPTDVSLSVGRAGRSLKSGSSPYLQVSGFCANQTFARIAVIRLGALTGSHGISTTTAVDTVGAAQWFVSNGRIGFNRARSVAMLDVAAPEVVAQALVTLGVSYDGATVSAFVNGRKAGSAASAQTFVLESSGAMFCRSSGQEMLADSEIFLHADFAGPQSDALMQRLTASPWQLFEPRRIPVPVSAAGGGPATFDASVSGTASTSAALTTAIRLAGSVNGSASVAAPLTTAIRFAGSVNATASTTAALTTAIRAAASVTGTATATGALTTAIRFAGSVAGSATVSANLSAGGGVAASVSASVTATAALTTSIRLAAAVSAQASASAALTTAIRLASAVSGSATTTAALTATSGGVAAAVTASASATASLTTAVRMAAIANASASASAALAGSIALTTGSVVYLPIRALTGLWSTSIASDADLTNLRAWLPPQRVALVDSNGVMRPEWYRFFHFLAETKLGGAAAATLPEIATSLTSAVAQSSAASLATASLAQQVTSNADALDVVVQVAVNNTLTGASSIPPVQRSTQQIQ